MLLCGHGLDDGNGCDLVGSKQVLPLFLHYGTSNNSATTILLLLLIPVLLLILGVLDVDGRKKQFNPFPTPKMIQY